MTAIVLSALISVIGIGVLWFAPSVGVENWGATITITGIAFLLISIVVYLYA